MRMAYFKLCLSLVALTLVQSQSSPNPSWTHEQYLNWLYTNFRGEFWPRGPSRQFAVVTVERLAQYPQVNADNLPSHFPTDWNAAYYADTAPDHTEPVLFERMRNMILDFLQEANRLPRDIYLYTYNVPCPACTTEILDRIRIQIPNTIREFIQMNPQYNHALAQMNDITYHFGWTIERGNREYTRAAMEEFADIADDPFEPGLEFYPRLRLNPAIFACNLLSGRKKRNPSGLSRELTSDWYSVPERWKQISAGVTGVWGVKTTGKLFYLGGTYEDNLHKGTTWEFVQSPLMKQAAVGNNTVWAVTDTGKIFRRTGIDVKVPKGESWDPIPGALQQISASSQEHIWGVNSHGAVYRRATENWVQVPGIFKEVTVGSGGVWGIVANGGIFYREGTFGDKDTSGTAWTRVGGSLKHISSADGMVWGTNVNDDVYYRLGQSLSNPRGTSWVSLDASLNYLSVSNRALWGVNSNNLPFARLSTFGFELAGGWELISDVTLKHISTGFAGVWGIDKGGNIRYRQSTYAAECNRKGSGGWENVGGNLKQLDVGRRVVWGVNTNEDVYIRRGIMFAKQTGTRWEAVTPQKMTHVTVSPAGHVWGVDNSGKIYRRAGAKNKTPVGSSWELVSGILSQISAGQAGVWGVNANNDVYYRVGTTGDVDTSGTTWTKVDGKKMKYITSGPRCVRALDLGNNVYYRGGMSLSNPTGDSWIKKHNLHLQQVEIYDEMNGIWGVSDDGRVFAKRF